MSEHEQKISFEIKDRFGREVGCILEIGEDDAGGHYYNIQSTRNGEKYGATNMRTQYFDTAGERDKAAAKAVAASCKAQTKKHAPKVTV